MECPNCHRENLAGAQFCTSCGASLAASSPPAETPQTETPPPAPPVVPVPPPAPPPTGPYAGGGGTSGSSALKPLLLGLAAAAVVGLLIGGGYILGTSGGGDESSPAAVAAASTDTPQPTATPIPVAPTTVPTLTPRPTATPRPPDRFNCSAIKGTDYRSLAEREWYLANCVPTPVLVPQVLRWISPIPTQQLWRNRTWRLLQPRYSRNIGQRNTSLLRWISPIPTHRGVHRNEPIQSMARRGVPSYPGAGSLPTRNNSGDLSP